MTQPKIEPQSPRPLVDILLIRPMVLLLKIDLVFHPAHGRGVR